MKTKHIIEPYRLLFPLGIIFGLIGVSLWIVYGLGSLDNYPAQSHSQLMIGAFLFAFAAGFLMTAIPKMTASFPAQPFELILACGLTLNNAAWSTSKYPSAFYFASAVSIFGLVAFFLRRFFARTKAIPPFFPFVLFGLLSGLTGALLLGFSSVYEGHSFGLSFGRKIYFEGMTLFLVLGIGSRLIPVISGRGIVDQPWNKSVLTNISLAAALFASYALQSSGEVLVGGVLKIFVITWIGYFGWGLFEKSKTKSRLAIGMKLSGTMVLAGVVMSVIQPGSTVHWMHLTYISGFGLMTLTVASRVILAHGSYDLVYETKSNTLWLSGALILTAAATRAAAPFTGAGYTMHLVYAAGVWILAMVIWSIVFVKRMLWKGTDQKSC